ncbi:hypothetical protein NDU88_000529 [Pleurodeles waltl]|uniref:MSP domain-containing protein n=1 Tax=Pleurodeles waltl TaxID=8319 RepID=A0AAV7KN23_PLEWA|nr:hypothetical protein NDU88_000529 [Pleurodeles waltl]
MAMQVLVLEPQDMLTFYGPFTDVVSALLKLHNPLKQNVAFRVKTTVPRRYSVRPSSGIIRGQSSFNVLVMLQPFNYDPFEADRHKFKIQSVIVPPDTSDVDEVWRNAIQEAIMESKLSCIFILPDASEKPPEVQTNKMTSTATESTESPAASTSEMYHLGDLGVEKLRDDYRKLQLDVQRLVKENNDLEVDKTQLLKPAPQPGLAVATSPAAIKDNPLNVKLLVLVVCLFFLTGVCIGKFAF